MKRKSLLFVLAVALILVATSCIIVPEAFIYDWTENDCMSFTYQGNNNTVFKPEPVPTSWAPNYIYHCLTFKIQNRTGVPVYIESSATNPSNFAAKLTLAGGRFYDGFHAACYVPAYGTAYLNIYFPTLYFESLNNASVTFYYSQAVQRNCTMRLSTNTDQRNTAVESSMNGYWNYGGYEYYFSGNNVIRVGQGQCLQGYFYGYENGRLNIYYSGSNLYEETRYRTDFIPLANPTYNPNVYHYSREYVPYHPTQICHTWHNTSTNVSYTISYNGSIGNITYQCGAVVKNGIWTCTDGLFNVTYSDNSTDCFAFAVGTAALILGGIIYSLSN